MAKVSGPLFSMDARNKFAGSLVFTAWKGRNVVRQLVTPSNPQSTNQVAARNRVRVTGSAQKQVNISTQHNTVGTLSDKALLIAKAPSGQAWNGFLTKSMIGAGDVTYAAASAAWAALSGANRTTWDSAAAARVPAFPAVSQQVAGGGAGTNMTAGENYFHQQYGMYAAGIFVAVPGAVPPTYA